MLCVFVEQVKYFKEDTWCMYLMIRRTMWAELRFLSLPFRKVILSFDSVFLCNEKCGLKMRRNIIGILARYKKQVFTTNDQLIWVRKIYILRQMLLSKITCIDVVSALFNFVYFLIFVFKYFSRNSMAISLSFWVLCCYFRSLNKINSNYLS